MMRYLTGLMPAALLLLGALRALPGQAETTPSADEVWERLAARDQAAGRFEQRLIGDDGELLEESSGRYAVLRPGFFRWEIDSPDRQLIVVSGDTLWHYDMDLASATRRAASDGGQFSPLELLAGEGDELRARFEVEALDADRFRLMPTFPGAGFAAVELGWSGDALVAMEIRDRSGQLIRLALDPDPASSSLSAADFDFQVPAGVEVYDSLQP